MSDRILRFLRIPQADAPPQPAAIGVMLTLLLLVFGAFMISLALISPVKYKEAIWEDGIIETLSATFWALAAVSASITLYTAKARTKYFIFAYVFLLVFFIACGGEEISWGQRIFDFRGPEALRAINKQHETNLHNIGSISLFANAFFFLFLLFFHYYPRQARAGFLKTFSRVNDLPMVTDQAIVIAFITLVIWVLIGARFGTLGFSPLTIWGYYTQMDDEIFECCAAFSYFALALLDLQAKEAARLLTFHD